MDLARGYDVELHASGAIFGRLRALTDMLQTNS